MRKPGVVDIVDKKAIHYPGRNGAKRVSVFGSYAGGRQRRGSDLDLLVSFRKGKSLLDLVRIER